MPPSNGKTCGLSPAWPPMMRADKGDDSATHRHWPCCRRIIPRTARRGIEHSTWPHRHRWKTERTIARLTEYRRLAIRYKHHGHLFAAFLHLAAALTCYKKLPTGDTRS